MSMTSLQLQTAFKNIGKFIKLAQIGDATGDTFKAHLMATNDQATDPTADTYELYRQVVMPLETSVARTVANVEAVQTRARVAIENYLTLLAADLGISAGASAAAKADALKTQLQQAAQLVEPSGSSSDGFYAYFKNNYNVPLPSGAPATILDSWITSTIVP